VQHRFLFENIVLKIERFPKTNISELKWTVVEILPCVAVGIENLSDYY